MQITIQYFAVLREQAGCAREQRETAAGTLAELYDEVRLARGLTLPRAMLKVAVNDEFCEWNQAFGPGDHVVFIPPVAGG
jgi:molybdopterin converting factor small subunit